MYLSEDIPLVSQIGKFANLVSCFPKEYKGIKNPMTTQSVKFVLSKYTLSEYLPHNYLTVIANEAKDKRYLIAFDKSWVIMGLQDYITERGPINNLIFHRFNDLIMVFAKVTFEEQERILTWLYQNIQLWAWNKSIAVFGLSKYKLKDIQHLYPVSITEFNNSHIIKSEILNEDQLNACLDLKTVYNIQGLDTIKATYATMLCMENTNYMYPMSWTKDTLTIWYAGYIGSEDLKMEFLRVLNQLLNVKFMEVDSYLDAIATSTIHKAKAFYSSGKWYVATLSTEINADQNEARNIIMNKMGCPVETLGEAIGLYRDQNNACQTIVISESMMIDVIKLFTSDLFGRLIGLHVMQLLGYTFEPEFPTCDITVSYEIVDIDEITTLWYYTSSAGQRVDFYTTKGKPSEEIKESIISTVKKCLILTQPQKSIFLRYKYLLSGDANISP